MNIKRFLFSSMLAAVTASGLDAQSLLDFPDLFGRQQQGRRQENSVKVEYDVDFQYFFDLRSFGASDEIFMTSQTVNVARFSPSAIVRFDQGREATHRVALGIDLTKDLGVNPTPNAVLAESEHDASLRNTALMKDIFFYYNYKGRYGKGTLDLYAGIHPRTVLGGEYTRAIFADEIAYYDPNFEGITVKYTGPRFNAELTADLLGSRGVDRVGGEMVFTAGAYKFLDWLSAGWSASYTHSNGNYMYVSDVDFALANPYVKADFGPMIGIQSLALKAGAIASYQFDYKIEDEKPHFPMGAEFVLDARHMNVGLENTFYYGDDQMVYRSGEYSDISNAATYAPFIYRGETFYFTRRSIPTWYDRAELYWKPLNTGFVSARFSAVAHFVTPAGKDENRIGPFIGTQAKATLLFNLDAFRHPREYAAPVQARSSRNNRQTRSGNGPRFSL